MNIALAGIYLMNLKNIGMNQRYIAKTKLDLALSSLVTLLLCLAIDRV
jgi:hypothetical protein